MTQFPTLEGVEHDSGVKLMSFASIGAMGGSGKVSVDVREILSLGVDQALYFINVSVTGGGQYDQASVASIDYEDLPRLIGAIKTIKGSPRIKKRLTSFECEVSAGQDFKAVVFDAKDKLMFGVYAGSEVCFFNDLSKVDQFVGLLERARELISSLADA